MLEEMFKAYERILPRLQLSPGRRPLSAVAQG
jgi:hypothetical protein